MHGRAVQRGHLSGQQRGRLGVPSVASATGISLPDAVPGTIYALQPHPDRRGDARNRAAAATPLGIDKIFLAGLHTPSKLPNGGLHASQHGLEHPARQVTLLGIPIDITLETLTQDAQRGHDKRHVFFLTKPDKLSGGDDEL